MAVLSDTASMALFCDFENVALGVRDAQYDKFDIQPILQRLLTKGSIVVKKAYCDWDRYKSFKSVMHEANFELIEIPHVRQSGKNSADIRLVVDALDLCYTKAHVDTFVIISGDSDFSPLVSKLRENAKQVIGVGVKQSTSDLLIANCDEFIFYDDLVRDHEAKRSANRKDVRDASARRSPEEERKGKEELEARKSKGIELAVTVLEDLMMTRSDSDRIWASVLKEAIKRRNPGFNESWYGFRSFGNLLEDAASRGFLLFGRDERSNAYVTRATTVKPAMTLAIATVPGSVPDVSGSAVSSDDQSRVAGDLADIPEFSATESSAQARRPSRQRKSKHPNIRSDEALTRAVTANEHGRWSPAEDGTSTPCLLHFNSDDDNPAPADNQAFVIELGDEASVGQSPAATPDHAGAAPAAKKARAISRSKKSTPAAKAPPSLATEPLPSPSPSLATTPPNTPRPRRKAAATKHQAKAD